MQHELLEARFFCSLSDVVPIVEASKTTEVMRLGHVTLSELLNDSVRFADLEYDGDK